MFFCGGGRSKLDCEANFVIEDGGCEKNQAEEETAIVCHLSERSGGRSEAEEEGATAAGSLGAWIFARDAWQVGRNTRGPSMTRRGFSTRRCDGDARPSEETTEEEASQTSNSRYGRKHRKTQARFRASGPPTTHFFFLQKPENVFLLNFLQEGIRESQPPRPTQNKSLARIPAPSASPSTSALAA